ncbi:casein kinase I [Drosophila willistoni]|uniref:casein kinase I n=1 Tax=Drosophila willistoni TaxID=7260 RepID=UPI000C26DA36|nr:casein kinase I [Drosophila willistoni]
MERLRAKEARNVTIGSYKFMHKFDAGAFGDIYLGTNILNGEKVAIKVESHRVRYPYLAYEWRVYKALQPSPGLPQIKYFCKEPSFNAMVMELMGPSLEHLFQKCHRCFTLKTILMLAEQMLQRLEYVHNHGFVHRDIKPENFVMGRGGKSKMVFLIDFGLAKKFWNPSTDVHIPYREDCGLTGTARYASLCSHDGMEQSRRDDLMSVGYVLIYFLRGSLPWQGLQASTKEQKYKLIQQTKQSISNERLCENIPSTCRSQCILTEKICTIGKC